MDSFFSDRNIKSKKEKEQSKKIEIENEWRWVDDYSFWKMVDDWFDVSLQFGEDAIIYLSHYKFKKIQRFSFFFVNKRYEIVFLNVITCVFVFCCFFISTVGYYFNTCHTSMMVNGANANGAKMDQFLKISSTATPQDLIVDTCYCLSYLSCLIFSSPSIIFFGSVPG